MRNANNLRQLAVVDDREHHLGGPLRVAAICVQHGHATSHLLEYGVLHFLRLLTDNLDFGACGSDQRHLIDRDGSHNDTNQTEEHALPGEEKSLREQRNHIRDDEAGAERQAQILLCHNRDYIHTAGRRSRAQHNAERKSGSESRKNRIQHEILGEHHTFQRMAPELQRNRADEGTEYRRHTEALADEDEAEQQSKYVQCEQERRHRKSRNLV